MLEKKMLENLGAWEIVCPYGADLIREMEQSNVINDLETCQSASGKDNLSYEIRYKDVGLKNSYLHSEIDPVEEASKSFLQLNLKNVNVIYVYGIGLGYFYEAAKAWLNESEDHYLVFLEDDPQVLRHFLRKDDSSKILFDRQVFLYFIGNEYQRIHAIGALTFNFADLEFVVTSLNSYLLSKPEIVSEITKDIAFFYIIHSAWKIDSVTIGHVLFFKNYVPNFFRLPSSYFGDLLTNKFNGIPAIICGAGPSLNKNIDILSGLSDKAIIIAGGTGLNALNAKGVMPTFGAGIDPNFEQYTRLIMNHAYHVPFIYRARMLPDALNMVHGDKVFISSGSVHSGAGWIEKQLGIFGLDIPEGFNVLNFSTSLASLMGCNPIICVGVDLAYSQGDSYASGIQSHALHDRNYHFRTKDKDEELVTKPDIYGNPVYTLWKWIAESAWYSNFSKPANGIHLINATEGGIGFEGVENMTLSEVKERFLTKSYDIESLVHGEIQNASLPNTCKDANIQAVFSKMQEDLKESEKIIVKIIELYESYSNGKKDFCDKNEVEELEKRLKESDIFLGFLKEFYDSFTSVMSLRINQLQRDFKREAKSQDIAYAKIELEKFQYLKNVTSFGANCLEKLLEEMRQNESAFKGNSNEGNLNDALLTGDIKSLNLSQNQASYIFEGDRFQIIDPDVGIHYEDNLISIPRHRETLHYASGGLKMEFYYKNDLLHGPVTFYSENQTVLSKSWYIEGKRAGRVIRSYGDGKLYSVQMYLEGQKVGVHHYFYQDGKLKMSLPYHLGLLNGDVMLFHPNGKIFRRLKFINDKRDGKEEIWDNEGRLNTEAYYHDGLAVLSTKVWHKNGTLAKEIIYESNSSKSETKQWDQNGVLLNEQKSTDYFDDMAEKTGLIASGLEDVTDKLSQMVKIFDGFVNDADPKVKKTETLEDTLKNIQEKLEIFKKAELHLKTQIESDLNSSKEAIWKSPEVKLSVTKNIVEMSQQMAQEMKAIEEGMKKIMEELKKKID